MPQAFEREKEVSANKIKHGEEIKRDSQGFSEWNIELSKDDGRQLMNCACQKLRVTEEMDRPRAEIDRVIQQCDRFPDA